MFGVEDVELSDREIRRRDAIATKHGGEFYCVAGNWGICTCGRGCKMGQCRIKHCWFTVPVNTSNEVVKAIMQEVRRTH